MGFVLRGFTFINFSQYTRVLEVDDGIDWGILRPFLRCCPMKQSGIVVEFFFLTIWLCKSDRDG